MRTRSGLRYGCWSVLLCASLAACVSQRSSVRPAVAPSAPPPPHAAAAARTAGEGQTEGPRRYHLDPHAVFPPPPAQGITAIRVPALLTEPAVAYLATPASAFRSDLRVTDVPVPEEVGGSGSPPAVAAAAAGPAAAPPPPGPAAPSLGVSFDSTTFDDNVTTTGGFIFIPADPSAAAGPNHLVSAVNVTLTFQQKNGTVDFRGSLASFFSVLSPLTFTFDPKVIFDQYAGRFIVLTLEQTDDGAGGSPETSKIFVAVSDDSDPNGTWYETAIDARTMVGGFDHWADFPGLAVDRDALYITANLFRFSAGGGSYGGSRLWILPKGLGSGGLYDGGLVSVGSFDPYGGGGIAATTQPAHVFGDAPAGGGTFLVSYSGFTEDGSGGSAEAVQVVRVSNPLGTPIFTQQFVDVGNLENLAAGLPLPGAPQSGSADLLSTNDRRALDAAWYDGSLWMTATIAPKAGDPDAGEATAHWWRLDTSGPGAITVADQGSVSGDDVASGTFTFFPSVAVNGAHEMALGFSGSASSLFGGSFYTDRLPADAPGTTSATSVLRSGVAFYERRLCGSRNRWGDYSSVSVDPTDGCFWVFNKHAIARGDALDCNGDKVADEDGRWGTAAGKFCPTGACPSEMVLASTTLAGTQVKKAAASITTLAGVTVATGADVTFRTHGTIRLGSGFKVASGATFVAEVVQNPCQ